MFLSREINIKLSKLYENSYIYNFVYLLKMENKKKLWKEQTWDSQAQIGCVFAEYDLFKPTTHRKLYVYEFGIILTLFYINFPRQEHQIDDLIVSFNAWDSQVLSYTPFIFPYSLFKHKFVSYLLLIQF